MIIIEYHIDHSWIQNVEIINDILSLNTHKKVSIKKSV